MARVLVIDERDGVAELIVSRLGESTAVETCQRAPQAEDGFAGLLSGGRAGLLSEQNMDTVVYSPPFEARRRPVPDLSHAEAVFKEASRAGVGQFVLLSSAEIYGASHHNIGFLSESRMLLRQEKKTPANRWLELESLAAFYLGDEREARLVILRAAATPHRGGGDYFSRLLKGGVAVTLAGHDPSIQLLSAEDLACAVRRAVERRARGVYNVAPDGAMPLRKALRLAGARRLPVPRTLQRLARSVAARAGLCHPVEQLDYVRYSWTVSNEKMKGELGFSPRRSSAEALREFRAAADGGGSPSKSEAFDDFGMDKSYVDAFGRTLFRFLHDRYWRVEVDGLGHVPREGRAILVGVHRGFMPWDAVMTLHLLARELGRYPRFLIHPGLIKFPFLFNFHTKLGGVIACQENAERLLAGDQILAIYPEGIRGAFALYRDAYRLGKFGRDEFVKMALRHGAPIIPFVTVGSAEIFPIIGKLNWNWWKRRTEWPFFPLTPTWPLAPVPLPSKWHTQYLAPVHVEHRYPPEAADDPETVRAISREVRARMEEAMHAMLRRRKSIFFGSVFGPEAAPGYEEKVGLYEEKVG
ncbi:MAG TPA: 1-acyl-sn-glycerol-3-phosphate acyltransferase [Pyrinomonadaceae bacterium]|jgi:1-acyl-sn-glycerol-3-phosphate acyltransferase|nr:1-acyl-sn-glycerol-3-phosphate acyltransferase [Pyrinomonadaceae bacterium]